MKRVIIKQNNLKGDTFQICFGGLDTWVFHFHLRHSDELTQFRGGMGPTVLTCSLWRGDQGATFGTIHIFFGPPVLV